MSVSLIALLNHCTERSLLYLALITQNCVNVFKRGGAFKMSLFLRPCMTVEYLPHLIKTNALRPAPVVIAPAFGFRCC